MLKIRKMNKEQLGMQITNILYKHTDQNEMKIREVDYKEVVADVVKLFAIPVVSNSVICEHKNEVTRQGDGFTYVVCGDCGEDL